MTVGEVYWSCGAKKDAGGAPCWVGASESSVSNPVAGPTGTTRDTVRRRQRDGTNSGITMARPTRASTPLNSMASNPCP